MSDNKKNIEERNREKEKTSIGKKHEYPAYYPHYIIKNGQMVKTSRKWWRAWLTYDWLIDAIETNINIRVALLIMSALIVTAILGAIFAAGILIGILALLGAFLLFGGIVVITRKKSSSGRYRKCTTRKGTTYCLWSSCNMDWCCYVYNRNCFNISRDIYLSIITLLNLL